MPFPSLPILTFFINWYFSLKPISTHILWFIKYPHLWCLIAATVHKRPLGSNLRPSVVLTTGVKWSTLKQANYAPQMPIYLMYPNEPKQCRADRSDAKLYVCNITLILNYIWQLLTEVEPINLSPYSYNTRTLSLVGVFWLSFIQVCFPAFFFNPFYFSHLKLLLWKSRAR